LPSSMTQLIVDRLFGASVIYLWLLYDIPRMCGKNRGCVINVALLLLIFCWRVSGSKVVISLSMSE